MSAVPPPRSAALRRWSWAALLTNAMIVVTGGTVRVTGSGLGCPDWPACEGGSVVPGAGADQGWHTLVEFGNRLLSFVVLAAVVGVLLRARRELGPRSTEARLGAWLVAGVLAQAVVGGVTVRLDLHWGTVTTHFLLSMALLAVAAALHLRVRAPGGTPPAADPGLRRAARAVPLLGAAVLVLGTIVTAAGPHAGDPGTARLDLPLTAVARTHSLTVWATVLLTVVVLRLARRTGHQPLTVAAGSLLAVEVVQGAVGYWQFLTGVPATLVLVHMGLACVFWVLAVRLGLLAAGVPAQAPQPHAAVAA